MRQLILLLLLFTFNLSTAQTENKSVLTIDQVMQGEDFVGYLPTDIVWSDTSKAIYFSWNPDNDTLRSTYKVDIASKKIDKLSFEDFMTTGISFTELSEKIFTLFEILAVTTGKISKG